MKRLLFSSASSLLLLAACHSPVWADDSTLPPDPPVVPSKPVVMILATDPTALKGTSSGAFTLIRTGATDADLVVPLKIEGTAVNGTDYTKLESTFTIPKDFQAADLLIQPLVTPDHTGNKTVIISIQDGDALSADLGSHRARVTIVDDIFNIPAPKIALTSPADGATFTLPANVEITADATAEAGTIKYVSFFRDDDLIGRVTNAPYSLTLTNPPLGEHTLFARAIDTLGKTALSAPVHIVVSGTPPKITLVSPKDDSTFTPGSPVDIEVEASGTGDTTVKLYGDSQLLKTFTAPPYKFTWENLRPGKHHLVAKVTDATGLTASASAEFMMVNTPPRIELTSPKDGESFKVGADIPLSVTLTGGNDVVTQVVYFAGNRVIATATTAPYTATWSKAAAGSYRVKAVVMTKQHQLRSSKLARITVTE